MFWFLGVGLLMCLVAATVGVTTLYLAGFTSLAVYSLELVDLVAGGRPGGVNGNTIDPGVVAEGA